jgi:hypothetical protein
MLGMDGVSVTTRTFDVPYWLLLMVLAVAAGLYLYRRHGTDRR